jgi:hypothetical protein
VHQVHPVRPQFYHMGLRVQDYYDLTVESAVPMVTGGLPLICKCDMPLPCKMAADSRQAQVQRCTKCTQFGHDPATWDYMCRMTKT